MLQGRAKYCVPPEDIGRVRYPFHAALLSLSPPLRFPPRYPITSPDLPIFLTRRASSLHVHCAASIMPSTRSLVLLFHLLVRTLMFHFSIPLVERSVFPISHFPSQACQISGEMGDRHSPSWRTEIMSQESRPPERRVMWGTLYLPLSTFPPRVRSASDGRSSRASANGKVVIEGFGLVPMRGHRSSQVGNPSQTPPATDVDDVRRLYFYFQIS